MQIAVLGSGTGIPTGDRGPAGYAVRADEQLLLLDSGSGSLEKLARLGMDYRRVGMVLITHCHADHTLDLVSLIHALNFTPGYVHERPLRAVGPPGFVAFLERLLSAYPSLQERSFAFEASEAGDGSVLDLGWVRITAVDVPHGNTRTNAYRLVTPDGVVVFSGDCSPSIALAHLARQADVMVSEASFAHTTVASDPHMTAGEAGHLAQAAGVGTLILTHLYPGSSEDDVRSACAREFRGRLIVARDGMCVELERAQLSTVD